MEKKPKLKHNQAKGKNLNPIKKLKKKKNEIENSNMSSESVFSSDDEKAGVVDDEIIIKKCKKCGKELRSDSKSKLCEGCKAQRIEKAKNTCKAVGGTALSVGFGLILKEITGGKIDISKD